MDAQEQSGYRCYMDAKKMKLDILATSKEDAQAKASAVLGCLPSSVTVDKHVIMHCSNCDYNWTYKGTRKIYATCPQCFRAIKLADSIKEAGV